MARDVATVKEIYDSFGKGDVPAILSHLHEDVEWEHDSVDHGIPWLKPRRGRNEVAKFFETLSALEFKQFEPRALLEGDRLVAAVISVEIMVKATGKAIRDLEMHLWTFNEEGIVVRFKHVLDSHQHFLAWRG